MTKHKALIGLFNLILMLLPHQALCWGQTGHRITGAIAERHLTAEAKSQITSILPNETLAEASTYADEMRSSPSEFWRKQANPWHYVTVPKGNAYHDVGAPPQGDAYSALKRFTDVLTSPDTPKPAKQLALRFIIHIIGDLHQPLHAGNGTDRGGNDLKVRFFDKETNLHWVWDNGLIAQKELSYSEWTNWLDKKITDEEIGQWHSLDPEIWIAESTAIRPRVYPSNGNAISYQYLYDHSPTITLRLKQAGIRIAHYLNNIFRAD